jgi:hypothetical protein
MMSGVVGALLLRDAALVWSYQMMKMQQLSLNSRYWRLVLFAAGVSVIAFLWLSMIAYGREITSGDEKQIPAAFRKTSEAPPETIPQAQSPLVRPALAYLSGGTTWDLSSEEFLYFLADTPKAILMRCPANHVSSDAQFHYYADFRFDREWAFERAPEDDFFVKRTVWSRGAGDSDWRIATTEATLATPW